MQETDVTFLKICGIEIHKIKIIKLRISRKIELLSTRQLENSTIALFCVTKRVGESIF